MSEKKEFIKKLKQINMNQKEFAKFTGRTEEALKKWTDESVPQWAWLIIKLVEENNDYKLFFESQKTINSIMNKYT